MADTEVKVRFTGDATGITAAAQKTTQALQGVKTSSTGATQAMINLGRVVQDAPYGFIGISNNLNPLLESFERLKAESGSVKGAISALGSSLVGAGGLGIAVSIVSSLMVVLSGHFFNSGKAAKDASGEVDDYTKNLHTAIDDLTKESSKIEVLVNFIQRENTSRKERIAAIKELQSIAPGYFAQLNAEKATVEEVSAAYAAFSQNITNSITARIREGQLSKIIEERIKLQDFVNSLGKEESVIINGTLVKARNFLLNTKDKSNAQARINQLLEQEKTIVNEINNLKPPDLKLDADKAVKSAKAVKEKVEKELNKAQPKFIDLPAQFGDESDFAKGTNTVKGKGVDFGQLPMSQLAKNLITLRTLAEDTAKAITNSLGQAFEGLFEGILSGSHNAFKAFAQALGNIVKKLIATAIAALAVAAILSAIPGFGAAVGISKAAGFASSFASVFKGLAGFKEGGIAQGPGTGYPVMLHGTEAVVPFEKIGQFANMVGGTPERVVERYELEGEKLSLVIERYKRRTGKFS